MGSFKSQIKEGTRLGNLPESRTLSPPDHRVCWISAVKHSIYLQYIIDNYIHALLVTLQMNRRSDPTTTWEQRCPARMQDVELCKPFGFHRHQDSDSRMILVQRNRTASHNTISTQ
uniref:Uncharacterized protein n=1 Tax=Nelumbo nucifera TaxID=4432 RepID=A0A822XS66_NELNU|nr:TPA_asm: hypothetical protein HUJ06_023454 [Nelumbo nucifera]